MGPNPRTEEQSEANADRAEPEVIRRIRITRLSFRAPKLGVRGSRQPESLNQKAKVEAEAPQGFAEVRRLRSDACFCAVAVSADPPPAVRQLID
jgi:hypothetical protein